MLFAHVASYVEEHRPFDVPTLRIVNDSNVGQPMDQLVGERGTPSD